MKAKSSLVCLLLICAWAPGSASEECSQEIRDPAAVGPCAVSRQVVTIGGSLTTYIHYPSARQCGTQLSAPYPGVALAHGFSMFGLINMALGHDGDGQHLASWGFVVATPVLPDDAEGRASDLQEVLTYLSEQSESQGSFLYHLVDADRLAVAGHSFGGATALAVAARDPRVKAVVSMDPVYHQGGPFSGEEPAFWDPPTEGPLIKAPTCILGAPSSNCNSESDYEEIYPFLGSAHKASILIVGASHCDFMDPGYTLCGFVCEGDLDSARTVLAQKYTTAWFNYYLHADPSSYDYLYGSAAQSDIASNKVVSEWDTAPKGFTVHVVAGAASLQWELMDHPMVAGYNVYRRLPDQPYGDTPYAQVGPASSYLDRDVAGGHTYIYTVRSHDPAGHEHQAAPEVEITVTEGPTPTLPPTATATPTQTVTLTPSPTASSTATMTPTSTVVATATATTAAPTRTPTATPVTSPTPCRLFVPAVLVSVRGLHELVTRARH